MNERSLKAARERIRNQFGSAVAAKASPEFCLAFGFQPPAAVTRTALIRTPGLERMATLEAWHPSAPRAVVLEFHPTLPNAGTEMKAKRPVPASKVHGTRAMLEQLTPTLTPESRISAIRVAREQFFSDASDVRIEIERGSRGGFQPGPESTASATVPSKVVEVCWLNSSLRTWADPRSLAEIAADGKIRALDLPKRLEAENIQIGVKLGVPKYHLRTKGTGKGVVVAVIDSEVAKSHPAFGKRVVPKHNYSRELWGNPDVHGTAVAGIIGGGSGSFEGIAPAATIYNYKVLATNRYLNGEDFDGALALQQALEDGVQIANCSWGAGPAKDGTSREARACNTAWSLGMTIVKSAGNLGPRAKTLTTPADAEGVIVVGATDLDCTTVQDYSSRGPTADGRHRPHVVACGGSDAAEVESCLVSGGYGPVGVGTSFAAPHVTGILALMLEAKPASSPDDLRRDLLAGCRKLSGVGPDVQGAGVVSI